ncbi:MAG: phosphoribosyl-AMP cyclohydrolase [Nitrospinae bacterium RIFCSPLOWO2_12_FULL_45_22]|nr:MAG: phosphoribosyl-AMP cyclohydrolase [Nitrospinae bacterium RIFCSPLOWO2_12_FULL_45_22]
MMEINFSKFNGLIPVIVQDYLSNEILMLAFMNQEAWDKTLETQKAHYWSRSRNKLWLKGEQSGHFQLVKKILIDCDDDTLLLKVEQIGGAACHTGYNSCFFRELKDGEFRIFKEEKIFDPEKVYGGKK